MRPALLLVGVTAIACSGCQCEKDRPFVPFRIEPSASALGAVSAAPSAPPPAFVPGRATMAPKDVSEWTLSGVALAVDPGRVIDRALVADVDGDGKPEGIAWTRLRAEPAESQMSGELVFFSERTPAGKVVAKIPGFVPSGPGCRHLLDLAQTGPRTVTLDVAATCDAKLLPRSPTRGLLVIAPAADRPTVLALRLADAAPGELPAFAVDSGDQDGDGRDDVRLVASMKVRPDDPEVAIALSWLDRAAGLARDAAEPRASLAALVSKETAREDGKNAARIVPLRVANARRLLSTLCAESGTARIFDADGAPIPCGDLAAAAADLLAAEVRAAVAGRDPLRAAAALGRDGWYAAPLAPRLRTQLEKEILSVAKARAATEAPIPTAPKAKAGLPRYSPLTFEPGGALLVQTAEGVTRVRLPDLQTEDATEGVEAWPLAVGDPPASRWTGIALPCERSDVLILESATDGSPLPPRVTGIIAPRPGPCGHGAVPTPELTPLEWTSARQAGFIGGSLFGVDGIEQLAATAPRGAPRSPDGKRLVVPWSKGLLVVGGGRAETWVLSDPAALSDCVVANGGAAAACIRGNQVVVLTPEAAKPGAK